MLVACKLLASVIPCSLYSTRKEQTRENQVGLRAGLGCVDQISAL